MGLISPWLTYRNSQGIVLVDDRDHSHVKQLRESILGVIILRFLRSVLAAIQTNRRKGMLLTSAISLLVNRIWATGTRTWENKPSQRLISLHCPTAASAYVNQSVHTGDPCHRII